MSTRIFSQAFMTMSVVVLTIISAAVETDIFVPSFPAIQDYFATTESKIQMIISVNFLGLCIASLFYGPLADSYGRRPILLIGMFIFAISSVACVLVNSIETMIFWRFMQGLGSSVAFVVPAAIIYDTFNQEKAAKMLGIYNSIITFAMSLAPIIGSFLYLTFNWRANFIFVAALAVIAFIAALIFVKESLDKEKRARLHVPSIMSSYATLLKNPKAMANLYLICGVCGAYFVYIANLSLIFINHFGVDEAHYGYYQAVILLLFAFVSFSSGYVIMHLGMDRTRKIGMRITVVGAIAFLAVVLFAPENPALITAAMAIFTSGFALSMGIFFSDYMSIYPEIRGVASALANSIRLFVMAALIAGASFFFNGTMMPVAIIVFFAGVSSLLVLYWLKAQKVAL
ncbi:MAG: multidrug effflux MFS transporter [Legionellales bacterium]|jgi:DHA1 family bicyclomycin/chloramphenicol resistance-like MFS transporter